MRYETQIRSVAASAFTARFGEVPRDVQLWRSRIDGGLESHVERIVARCRTRNGRTQLVSFIAKRLEGTAAREARVYGEVVENLHDPLAPQVFAVCSHADHVDLYLEDVPAVDDWPWREIAASRALLQRLAVLHMSTRRIRPDIPDWDYERELSASAVRTLERLQRMRRVPEYSRLTRGAIRPVERFVSNLDARRLELSRFDGFGDCLIHGDVHPGNVIVRRCDPWHEPLLIDWSRARIGSALEDVSSWLHSLGHWEPEARRRHDTLIKSYLSDIGHDRPLCPDVRAGLWVAAASNALAGALSHYCAKALHGRSVQERAHAAHQVRNWLRPIVRADALSR